MKTVNARELEFETTDLLTSSIQEQGSAGTVAAMAGCMLSLLVMLCA